MMFPGHPYLRQQVRRAEQDKEQDERHRVWFLIQTRRTRLKASDRETYDAEEVDKLLDGLQREVRSGFRGRPV